MIKLSILIPVHNQEKLILRALESIPKRSDIEIIVIDDCSNDSTLKVVNEYLKNTNYNSVVIHNDSNIGCAASLNKALDICNGEYTLQLDSDDYLLKDNFNSFLDYVYGLDSDFIFFINETNNGEQLTPGITPGLCDHVCLYRRSYIGNARYPELRCTAGYHFHFPLYDKPHTESLYDKVIYHYNYPREGSNIDLYKKGLLKP